MQAALTGPWSLANAALPGEFLAKFDIASCSPDQLLTVADLGMRCRHTSITADSLRQLVAIGARLHLAHYRLGRLDLAEGRLAEAAAEFDFGAAANPDFAFNHMGAARARHAQGLRQEAVPFAERFATFGVRPHTTEDFAVLGDIADLLFDSGDRDRATTIYALLLTFGMQRPRHIVRLAETRMANGDFPGAGALLRDHVSRHGPEPWISRALADCSSHSGDHEAAIAHAIQALQADPSDPGFMATFLRVVGKSNDPATIRQAMTDASDWLKPDDDVELTVRLHLAEAAFDEATGILMAADIAAESRLHALGLEAAYAVLAGGAHDLASMLAARMSEVSPADVPTIILQIDVRLRQLRWEEAGDILATLPEAPDERPQLTMKRLEYACFAGNTEAACAYAVHLENLAARQRQLMLPVFRFLAEQQDWHGVVDRALPWIDASVNYGQIGYVLFRAARQTGREAEMQCCIEAVPHWSTRQALVALRNSLACAQVRSVADAEILLADAAVAADLTLLRRLKIQRDVLAQGNTGPSRDAIFLCTDRNYLCGTIVALHHLAGHKPQPMVDFFIVADDDILELTRNAVRAFTEAGITITIVPASAIIGAAETLPAEYGLFTSGHRLSSAAYYRIYFIRHLRSLGCHTRALYVDSDVLLTGTVAGMFDQPMHGQPIAARPETDRPDVRRAIAHHALPDGQYFNSGVLLIDLLHPRLDESLNEAVAAISDESVTLLYHDQCALNLGFRSLFAPLDMSRNFPVQADTRNADIPPGTMLLHFLGRPKPWSAAYTGELGLLWFAQWQEAAAFIGAEQATLLLAEVRD